MPENLRAQILEEALKELREAFASGKVKVKGWPAIGSVSFDHLPESAVKLFMAL